MLKSKYVSKSLQWNNFWRPFGKCQSVQIVKQMGFNLIIFFFCASFVFTSETLPIAYFIFIYYLYRCCWWWNSRNKKKERKKKAWKVYHFKHNHAKYIKASLHAFISISPCFYGLCHLLKDSFSLFVSQLFFWTLWNCTKKNQ